MPSRRALAIAWTIAAFGIAFGGWVFYAGPFRWFAEWQVENFGSYEVRITIFGPLIVLLLPAGFLNGWGPLGAVRPVNPAVRVANARRNARIVGFLGLGALAIGATAGVLGYHKSHTPLTHADLVLTAGAETTPEADLVTVTGIARTDLIVGYRETAGGVTNHWSFVPLVPPGWRAGEPIRFVLKTNQTAWMPPAGTLGQRTMHMLRADSAPFLMITAPSVLERYSMPGLVRAEYEKARVPLDRSVAVVQQSAGEVYAPYWIVASLGGLVGVCMVLGGLIGSVNARKAAAA